MIPSSFFFFNDTATTEIYTLSLHDALPICPRAPGTRCRWRATPPRTVAPGRAGDFPLGPRSRAGATVRGGVALHLDRKSTRLNSSHGYSSYAVFCLKKKIMYDV